MVWCEWWKLFDFRQNVTKYTDRSGSGRDWLSASQGPVQFAAPGDIAAGRVLREENKELDLDTSPCSGSRVIRFDDPYERSIIGKLNCSDRTCDRIHVRQKIVPT